MYFQDAFVPLQNHDFSQELTLGGLISKSCRETRPGQEPIYTCPTFVNFGHLCHSSLLEKKTMFSSVENQKGKQDKVILLIV